MHVRVSVATVARAGDMFCGTAMATKERRKARIHLQDRIVGLRRDQTGDHGGMVEVVRTRKMLLLLLQERKVQYLAQLALVETPVHARIDRFLQLGALGDDASVLTDAQVDGTWPAGY